MFAGSFGLFFTLFLLFCRFMPIVAIAEVKSVTKEAHAHHDEPHKQTADQARADYRPDEHHNGHH
jgi:molybdopterin-containing oxidoreductase family membrane subunit